MCVIGITPINNDVKEEKSMKFLQKLGKALMLPVAVLPICGILMGCLLYTSPSPRDVEESRMPSSA